MLLNCVMSSSYKKQQKWNSDTLIAPLHGDVSEILHRTQNWPDDYRDLWWTYRWSGLQPRGTDRSRWMAAQVKFIFYNQCAITGSTMLELRRIILDIGPHNCSVPDFAISGLVIQKWGQTAQWHFSISPIITGPNILNFHMVILNIDPHKHSVFDFPISGHVTQKWGQSWKFLMKVDRYLHDCSISYFSTFDHMTQKWDQRSKNDLFLSL